MPSVTWARVVRGYGILGLSIRFGVFRHGVLEDLVADLGWNGAVVEGRGGLRIHGHGTGVEREGSG